MKTIKDLKIFSAKFVLIWLLLFSLPSFYSLIRPGFYTMQDDLQAFRLQQMDICFQDGQFPCRWVPDMGFKYGYPNFNYYSPSVFYLGEIFHVMGMQFIDVIKLLFVLALLLSVLTMFLFLRSMFGVTPAFIGSLLYLYSPFRATEIYVRGSLNEAWALVFFPLIFWSSYLLIKKGSLKYFTYLSMSVGLLLITHNLMSLIFLPILGLWILHWLIVEKNTKVIPKLVGAFVLALGLSLFFVLPVIAERQYVHVESLVGGYFDYRQHFVSFKQLFFSNYFGYGSSVLGLGDDVALSTGIVHWVYGFLALPFAFLYFKRDKKTAQLVFFLWLIELGVLFLMHQKSSFIWERITVLSWLQFPWRFLGISVFLLSILGAISTEFLSKLNPKIYWMSLVLVVVSLFALNMNFYQPKDWFDLTDEEKFSGASWEKQLTVSIFDYQPIYAEFPPPHKAMDLPEVLEGSVHFRDFKRGSNFQTFQTESSGSAVIRLQMFDFPGMLAKIDGQITGSRNNDCRGQQFCLGLITITVPAGLHQVVVKLENTVPRDFGNWITVSSIVIWLMLLDRKSVV